jgi:hypothetical protein
MLPVVNLNTDPSCSQDPQPHGPIPNLLPSPALFLAEHPDIRTAITISTITTLSNALTMSNPGTGHTQQASAPVVGAAGTTTTANAHDANAAPSHENRLPFLVLYLISTRNRQYATIPAGPPLVPIVDSPGAPHSNVCTECAGWSDFETEEECMRFFFEGNVHMHWRCFQACGVGHEHKVHHWLVKRDVSKSEVQHYLKMANKYIRSAP